MIKQSSLDDHDSLGMDLETGMSSDNGDEVVETSEYDERRPTEFPEDMLYKTYATSPVHSPLPQARGELRIHTLAPILLLCSLE